MDGGRRYDLLHDMAEIFHEIAFIRSQTAYRSPCKEIGCKPGVCLDSTDSTDLISCHASLLPVAE